LRGKELLLNSSSNISVIRGKVDPSIQQVVTLVDSSILFSDLAQLESYKTRYAGNASGRDSLARARDWLIQQFTEYGYTDIQQHNFTQGGNQLQNIIVTKTGTLYPDSIIIVCGHYDTVNGPGINDNGTGTAVVLEVARVLVSKQLDYTVRFICFSAEEQGLVGSNAYVQSVVVPQSHKLKLVLNVDEIGGIRESPVNIVKVEKDNSNPSGNNAASAFWTDSLASLTRTYSTLQTTITNAFGTDYVPFQQAGYVITGYYEFNQTPHYHQPTDSLSHVDVRYVKEICKGTVAGVAVFGGMHGKFLSLYHSPLSTTQDTVNAYSPKLFVKSSSPITSATLKYEVNNVFIDSVMQFLGTSSDTMFFGGTIPPFPYGSVVNYYFECTNEDSIVTVLPPTPDDYFSFSVLPDTISPTIIHTPISSVSYLDFPLTISSNISDANGIANAWIDWTKNGISFVDTMEEISTNNWQGSIFGNISTDDSITYVIYAKDNSLRHNITRYPTENAFHFKVLNTLLLLHSVTSDSGNFSPNNDWQFGNPTTGDIPPSPTGLKVWGTNLSGNYTNNVTSLLQTEVISLVGKKNIALTFKHYFKTEPGNDGGNVQISVDGGAYQLLIPQGGYPYANVGALNASGYAGNSFTWQTVRISLDSMKNHTIKLQWKFASDALTNFRGWYIDAVRLDYLVDSTVNVSEEDIVPKKYLLSQNYPNPFNPSTNFRFQISDFGFVLLKVYNLLGKEIATLLNENKEAGNYNVEWNANGFPSGMYFYKISVVRNGFTHYTETKKMILLK